MNLENKLRLRPRFDKISSKSIDEIKSSSEALKSTTEPKLRIKNSDQYIWLSVGLLDREYWSPNLRLELEKREDSKTLVKVLYSPDPVLWVLFVGLHCILAIIFIVFAVIVYSKWINHQTSSFDFLVMGVVIIVWLLLYFIARLKRKKASTQAQELLDLMNKII
ncbi:hypothetical protein [Flavobacterium sp. '19STA2R22 D10 B1']|uniref:hypothetical protein n=1 Tax=Flavobacterium aerium TaxID=3037261 RepID=UPI00278C0E14|nr:hypothetical protein [Flavobacterium sp. '19STA2R22 D10 B1']